MLSSPSFDISMLESHCCDVVKWIPHNMDKLDLGASCFLQKMNSINGIVFHHRPGCKRPRLVTDDLLIKQILRVLKQLYSQRSEDLRKFAKISRRPSKICEDIPKTSDDLRRYPEDLRRFLKISRRPPTTCEDIPKTSEDLTRYSIFPCTAICTIPSVITAGS